MRRQLEAVLASPSFRTAERSKKLLRFVVEQTLAGKADELKDYTIGAEALGRGKAFDPRTDAIARVEVSRLRGRLDQYYATDGATDRFRFVLPRGSYVPLIEKTEPAAPADEVSISGPQVRARGSWLWTAILCLGCSVIVGAVTFVYLSTSIPASPAHPPVLVDMELLPEGEFANVVGTQLSLAPDGSSIVFVARTPGGGSELQLRRLEGSGNVRLPGTEGARGPFFSPDSEWVSFWSTGKLKKIALTGGSPITICDAPDLLGGSWGEDGYIVATLTTEAKLWRVPAGGGKPVPILDATPRILRFLWPQVLPGARAVLFSNFALNPDAGSIEVLTLAEGKRRTLVQNAMFGRYLPSGHLVYINQGSLYALRFDLEKLQILGSPVLVASEVEFSPTFGYAQYDVSRNGTLVFRRRSAAGQFSLNLAPPSGDPRRISEVPPGYWIWPKISPNGRHAAVDRMESGERKIWMVDLANKTAPVPFTPPGTGSAVWLPDGAALVFQGDRTIDWAPNTTPAKPRTLLSAGICIPWSISPDGKRLAYSVLNPQTHFDLWTVPLSWSGSELRAGTPEPFLTTPAVETYPSFSPDGQWMAYVSLQSGTYEVYVKSFGRDGAEVQVSKGGGRLPIWLKRKREIVYETSDHRLMSVDWHVRNGAFEVGQPRSWSETRLGDTGVLPNFDVAANGEMLALLPPAGLKQVRNQVTFRFHFFEELERRLPRP